MNERPDALAPPDTLGGSTPRLPSIVARFASFGLAAVFLILTVFAMSSAIVSFRAGMAAQHAGRLSDIYTTAKFLVGEEESLERKYRIEPGPAIRARHLAAGVALLASLEQARALGGNSAFVDDVAARHRSYLEAIGRMFTAIDNGNSTLATEIDGASVDPSFDAIVTMVNAAADTEAAVDSAQTDNLIRTLRFVLIVTPLVFVPGLALVSIFWVQLGRSRRDIIKGLTREAAVIRSSERRFQCLLQNASDTILICCPDGTVTHQGPMVESLWGYGRTELLHRPLADIVHADDQPALFALWEQLLLARGTTKDVQLRVRKSDGTWRDVDLILTNLLGEPAVAGLAVTGRDITERKAFEALLTKQAFHDAVTGLPNRVLLRDRLAQALARAARRFSTVGLLFIDLDNFKQINDSLGHHVGDKLLSEAATRLRACVRDENTVARLGGDEFVILLDYLQSDAEAELVAERVCTAFALPFNLENRNLYVTASIGIALGYAGQGVADNMLRDADVAMYRAKSAGKARHVVFNSSMQVDILAALELENDLRHAITEHELRVHYQPIVSFEGGGVSEVEALVRWQHPTRGLIPPASFIPVAEATGLILPLGQWVLDEACRQAAAWQSDYPSTPPLVVSVNLSPRQFQLVTLVSDVKRALEESGLPPSSLKLEITESTIMQDVEKTIATLWELKGLGIKFAIDDFGTGYSSLAYLKRLPLDVLKIDRSFVSGIGQDSEDTAIVRAVIAMAKSLNLTITAEGIETAEQSDLLQEWNCDRGQGYFFSRPVEADQCALILKAAATHDARPFEAAA
jgi:diguanylate cyclase (GGDEF)-like protein/PAS domain S-box-containing protein